MRSEHEASCHQDNCFLTLTFDEDHLPKDGSLSLRTFQLFMKKLRKAYSNEKFKYYHCGEYGEQFGRPHYHALIFNLNFEDQVFYQTTEAEHKIYTSEKLTKIWGNGNAYIGELTFDSAAYVARYCMKKITGDQAAEHYKGKKPEYSSMSNGIAYEWFKKYKDDVYPHDYIVVNGKKLKPAKFYDTLYEKLNPEGFKDIKRKRDPLFNKKLKDHADINYENSQRRLNVKEIVKKAQIKSLQRGYQ